MDVSAMSPAQLSAEGQRTYQAGTYDKAVQLFSNALALLRSSGGKAAQILPILDFRTSAYAKLGNLDLAMGDAKAMVRTDRADARGYLRCAKICRLQHDDRSALKWYAHGLKNVPTTDSLFEYLQTQHQKTADVAAAKLKLSKAADPVLRLPAEVFDLIVSYLDYRQSVAVLRVSKKWARILSARKPLADTLDFSNAHTPLTYAQMNASLRRLSKWPKMIVAENLSEPAARCLVAHLNRWVNYGTLESLVVNSASAGFTALPFRRYNLKRIFFGRMASISLGNVNDALRCCPLIESATFAKIEVPNLTAILSCEQTLSQLKSLHLEVDSPTQPKVSIPLAFFEKIPNLSKLEIIGGALGAMTYEKLDLSPLKTLRHLNLSQCRVPSRFILPSSLQKWKSVSSVFLPGDSLPPQILPNLRAITVQGCYGPAHLLTSGRSEDGEGVLTHLNLDAETDPNQASLRELLGKDRYLKNLRHLKLKCQELKDEHTEIFITQMPLLEELHLTNAAITGVFLVELLTAPSSRINFVRLVDCSRVFHDAVEWARSRGAIVEVINQELNFERTSRPSRFQMNAF